MNASSFHFCGWWDSHFFVSDHAKKVVFQKQIPKTTFEACLKNAQNLTLCRFSTIGCSEKIQKCFKNVFENTICSELYRILKNVFDQALLFLTVFGLFLLSVTLKKMKMRVSNCFWNRFWAFIDEKYLKNFCTNPVIKSLKLSKNGRHVQKHQKRFPPSGP